MPLMAPKPCRHTGCAALVRDGSGFCATHQGERQQQVDSQRGSSTARGYGYRWQKASKAYLAKHPLCECPECKGDDPSQLSAAVDHVVPHRLFEAEASKDPIAIARARSLFWDSNNWCAMSKLHHDRKTWRETHTRALHATAGALAPAARPGVGPISGPPKS